MTVFDRYHRSQPLRVTPYQRRNCAMYWQYINVQSVCSVPVRRVGVHAVLILTG